MDTGDDSHIKDTAPQEIELTAGCGVKELFFFNDTKPGMKLVKVDSADPSKTIPGVKFSIRAIDGSYGPQEFVTDSRGEIDLSKLPVGSYEVTELECPGYVVDNAQRIIHLRANDTAEFVFTNTKKPGLRLVKTSADGSPLDGVTFKSLFNISTCAYWRGDFLSCKAKIRRHPDGWQGFLTQSGRKIHRQDVRGEILNRL